MNRNAAMQLPLDLVHRPAQGREDFLIAPCNQDAVTWIDRFPDWPGPALILYGPPSCGKTHLAAVWKNMTGAAFIESEALGHETADRLAARGTHLVLDNIDPWFGDRQAETTMFHLYNIMREERRFLLVTSRIAPEHAVFEIADLASRLRAAPVATIRQPDDALLSAILIKLFADRQIKIGPDVLNYIIPRMERSFAAIHELVAAADRLALSEKRPISVPLIRRIFLMQSESRQPSFWD